MPKVRREEVLLHATVGVICFYLSISRLCAGDGVFQFILEK